MHETDAHPVHHQARRALANLDEPALQALLRRPGQFRKVARHGEFGELLQQGRVAARRRQLEMSEADERGRDAADDGALLFDRMPVVEHVAHHFFAGRHQRQRARRRHAKVVHRLAAQELADRRAQHGATVGATRIRRRAGPLQLQFVAASAGVDRLAEEDCAAVAELPGPGTELVPAVAGRVRRHARQQRVAGQRLDPGARLQLVHGDPQFVGHFARIRQQARRRDRRRHDWRPERAEHLARIVAAVIVAGQLAQQAVVEMEHEGVALRRVSR